MIKKKDIPVYLFTGFLESGKTRFMQEMLADDGISQEQKENIKILCSFMGGTVA